MAKFYAVRKGRQTGIFETWDACRAQTSGYSGAEFKSFPTRQQAQDFLAGADPVGDPEEKPQSSEAPGLVLPEVYAFTDGSFNKFKKPPVYGYGGFLHYSDHEEDIPLRGHGTDERFAASWNVAGEVFGAIAAMEKALELGLEELTLIYDYEGVEKWLTGVWQANKPISQAYVKAYKEIAPRLKMHFIHVDAHTGVPGNELADQMAKEEAGNL
jgi:ribonuclease HI